MKSLSKSRQWLPSCWRGYLENFTGKLLFILFSPTNITSSMSSTS